MQYESRFLFCYYAKFIDNISLGMKPSFLIQASQLWFSYVWGNLCLALLQDKYHKICFDKICWDDCEFRVVNCAHTKYGLMLVTCVIHVPAQCWPLTCYMFLLNNCCQRLTSCRRSWLQAIAMGLIMSNDSVHRMGKFRQTCFRFLFS